MRCLTELELELVAGGALPEPPEGGGDTGGDTGGTGGTGGTTTTTPPPPVLHTGTAGWAAAYSNLQTFFSDLDGATDRYREGDQNSNYDYSGDYAPMNGFMQESFGWIPNVANDPSAHFFDYLTQDIDPEFQVMTFGTNYFTGTFTGGSASVKAIDAQSIWVNINGMSTFLTYRAGAVTQAGDEIIVTAGSWHVEGIAATVSAPAYDPRTTPPPTSTGTVAYPTGWDHQRDANIDRKASELVAAITAMPDDDKYEYVAFVYKDANGVLHKSGFLKGANTSVDIFSKSPSYFGMTSWSQVVAMVHNHPTLKLEANGTYTTAPYFRGYPSDGDFAHEQWFATVSGDSQWRQYISYNGVTSEYDWIHNSNVQYAPDSAVIGAVKSNYTPQLGQP